VAGGRSREIEESSRMKELEKTYFIKQNIAKRKKERTERISTS
jgi:hypothetical protein